MTVAETLAELIGYRTDNPGGDEAALCRALGTRLEALGADQVTVVELPREPGTGAYVHARFGQPRLVVNAHVDTVPANRGWTRDPFAALRERDRVIGLGAADTKGAIAAILHALALGPPRDTAILFSGDEERGTTCQRAFLASPAARGLERAIVCEPTARGVGVAHRGILAYRARLRAEGGHSSRADRLTNPLTQMARLAVAVDELGRRLCDSGPPGMTGLCLNIAGLDGGVAFNVVPEVAELSFSIRPAPGSDLAALDGDLRQLARHISAEVILECVLDHRPFATRAAAGFAPLLGDALGASRSVDFWTEAALFAEAGIDAVVVGPGDIAQAHAADEWVSLADLDWAVELFTRAFAATH